MFQVTSFTDSGILYTRAIGASDKEKADRIFSVGVISVGALAVLVPVLFILFKDIYFQTSGTTGTILGLAREYHYGRE